ETLLRQTPILEIRPRGAKVAASGNVNLTDIHEPIRFFKRKTADQHAIDQGEHCGVHPDAERQRQNDDYRKPSLLEQQPYGKPAILKRIHCVRLWKTTLYCQVLDETLPRTDQGNMRQGENSGHFRSSSDAHCGVLSLWHVVQESGIFDATP